jgi:hypothetical protein
MFTVPAAAIRLAAIGAVSLVELTRVGVSAVVPHFAVAPSTKLVPLMVSVKAAPPATAVLGLRLVIVGLGGRMVKVAAAEVPPLVVTVTLAFPAAAIRLAAIGAVSLVELTRVGVSAVLPHFAVTPETKLVPLMVSVKAAPPATAVLGLRLVIVGLGGRIVKLAAAEVPPLVVTVTLATPAAEIRPAGTGAVNLVEFANVVANAVAPHFAVAPDTKFVPLMVSVKAAPPATAILGLRLVIVGLGGRIVKVAAAEVPPLVVTVTLAFPAEATRLAAIGAVSLVELTRVGVSAVLPHFAVTPETKFVPLMVSVKAAPPANAVLGLRLVIVGLGGRIVKLAAADVPPAVVTVTLAKPAAAIRPAGTGAVNLVEFATVVANAFVPHFAVAPETKFVPLMVSVKAAPPATAVLGLRLVMVGAAARAGGAARNSIVNDTTNARDRGRKRKDSIMRFYSACVFRFQVRALTSSLSREKR